MSCLIIIPTSHIIRFTLLLFLQLFLSHIPRSSLLASPSLTFSVTFPTSLVSCLSPQSLSTFFSFFLLFPVSYLAYYPSLANRCLSSHFRRFLLSLSSSIFRDAYFFLLRKLFFPASLPLQTSHSPPYLRNIRLSRHRRSESILPFPSLVLRPFIFPKLRWLLSSPWLTLAISWTRARR